MTVLILIILTALLSILVHMLFGVFYHVLDLNHIRYPEPDWKQEVAEILLVAMLLTPFAGMVL